MKISKLSLVAIILAAFAMASVSDLPVFCDMGECEMAMATESHHHDSNQDSDGCCSNGDDCCCETLSIPLLVDMPKLVVPTPQYKVNTFSESLCARYNNTTNPEYASGRLTPYQSKPPPKIPDIRVFIQSIII